MNLEEWFKKRCFRAESYCDVDALVEAKKEKGETISVVIPSLNEEENIGKVIRTIREELVDKKPLVDEIIVMDGGSEDDTKKVARKEGARFYLSSEVLKRYSGEKGKGDNLWKGLYTSKGSIIVYLDADLENIHPRFVCGLVGPLLKQDKLRFVKSYFDRPPKEDSNGEEILGGGRVTELLVRPLFNMYFPSLAGFIQPLSGQVAGRRSALEKLSYPAGYGVDVGILIDVYKKYGLEKIAQVDLGVLEHRNHNLPKLSMMAFVILGIFASRAHVLGKVILSEDVRKTYHTVIRQGGKANGKHVLRKKQVVREERDPMITIKLYRNKFHKKEFRETS